MRRNPILTVAQLNCVYDILVRECWALPTDRDNFLHHQSKQPTDDQHEPWPKEWRFGGNLGFGGKFWRSSGRIYVSCYPEDETPQRREIIRTANVALAKILE